MSAVLIYEHLCRFCRTLAYLANRLSKRKIKLVPYGSALAEELLSYFFPNGHPYNFYLITHDGKLYTGLKAVIRGLKIIFLGR